MPDLDLLHLGLSVLSPGTSHGPHVARQAELVWMVEGSAVAIVRNEPVELGPETALLVHPGDEVAYHWGRDGVVHQGFVVFAVEGGVPPQWPRRIALGATDVVRPLLDHILWLESRRPAGWWSAVGQAFAYALRAVADGYLDAAASPERTLPAPIVASIRHVGRTWAASDVLIGVPLTELAASAGVTPEHLCRVYAREFGMGPVETVRLLRLKRAALLLAQSNLAVGEVARLTGFASQFHFARRFRAAAGMTPSLFRHERTRGFDVPGSLRRVESYLTAD